jgi:hypothetical protein
VGAREGTVAGGTAERWGRCWWSPTGDHLFQLVELDTDDRPGYVLANRCGYCGGLAFAVPGQRSGPMTVSGSPAGASTTSHAMQQGR